MNATLEREKAMAKKRADGATPDDLKSIKIKLEKHRQLTILAAHAGVKISEYLDRLLEKPLADAWAKHRREQASQS